MSNSRLNAASKGQLSFNTRDLLWTLDTQLWTLQLSLWTLNSGLARFNRAGAFQCRRPVDQTVDVSGLLQRWPNRLKHLRAGGLFAA